MQLLAPRLLEVVATTANGMNNDAQKTPVICMVYGGQLFLVAVWRLAMLEIMLMVFLSQQGVRV
jgi:hypothetical protein